MNQKAKELWENYGKEDLTNLTFRDFNETKSYITFTFIHNDEKMRKMIPFVSFTYMK